jgi:ubiquinone/menaquinone biosynthesis C-methylase UbiE
MRDIKEVEDFWNLNPCGLPADFSTVDKKEKFLEIDRERYLKQKRIIEFADFTAFKGKKVLEIGCGIGSDAEQFAKAGAIYTGVDLTESAVSITKERFEIFGLSGLIRKADAEALPFDDNSFDHVYSFGVIHHSPNPEKIVSEIYRVLKPGGTIAIMLYNKTSFYYLIEVCFIRKVVFLFCEKKLFWQNIFRLFGRKSYRRFELFREKLEKIKLMNPKPNDLEWISMNTDNVFCPIARVYSRKEAQALFYKFRNFKTRVWFIDKDNWFIWITLGKFIPPVVANLLERSFGWLRMIDAVK